MAVKVMPASLRASSPVKVGRYFCQIFITKNGSIWELFYENQFRQETDFLTFYNEKMSVYCIQSLMLLLLGFGILFSGVGIAAWKTEVKYSPTLTCLLNTNSSLHDYCYNKSFADDFMGIICGTEDYVIKSDIQQIISLEYDRERCYKLTRIELSMAAPVFAMVFSVLVFMTNIITCCITMKYEKDTSTL